MDIKASVALPAQELTACSSTIVCACCQRAEEIDLMRLCCRCGQFTHEAGEAGCPGVCGCESRVHLKPRL